MSQICERVFVLMVIFQYTHQQPKIEYHGENAEVSLNCNPPRKGAVTTWFRIGLQKDQFDFLASFTINGDLRQNKYPTVFSGEKIKQNILTLKNFQKARDSGIYSCSSFNGNILYFGKATSIQGIPEAKPTIKTVAAATSTFLKPRNSTSVPCTQQGSMDPNKLQPKELHTMIKCELVIFAPLAGGCGLLLLILLITICYCNRIRRKRCPHHHKRTAKKTAPVRQATPDRYV